jgi:16S rRNA A1518/A1519 N6-dimethyltransferase RsmA/KsgA/DIM1 with predicted DNA glycosylase/AP lyase activity
VLARGDRDRELPPTAFWPKPQVASQFLRLDFDAEAAAGVLDADALRVLMRTVFTQRRKKIIAVTRRRDAPYYPPAFLEGLHQAGIDPGARPWQIAPANYAALANILAEDMDQGHVVR